MDLFPKSLFSLGMQGRNISPEYRDLELRTQVKLTPECRARVGPEGEILGIYESFAGVRQAILRNETDMALFFLARLNPLARERLISDLKGAQILPPSPLKSLALRTVMQELNITPRDRLYMMFFSDFTPKLEEIASGVRDLPREEFKYRKTLQQIYKLIELGSAEALEVALDIFRRGTKDNREEESYVIFDKCLISGEVSLVNRAIEYIPKYYKNFLFTSKVEELTEEIKYAPRTERSIFSFIKKSNPNEYAEDLLGYAKKGNNPRLIAYIYACIPVIRSGPFGTNSLLDGYSLHRDLLSCFTCLTCFDDIKPDYLHFSDSIDLNRLMLTKVSPLKREHIHEFMFSNLGNIDILFYILDTYPEEKDYIRQVVQEKYSGLYPLTERILAES